MPGIVDDLDVSRLKQSPPYPRSKSSDACDLANSINQRGLLHPIVVRTKEEYFEIIAGNRRFEACKLLKWRKIPCHILELDDREAFEASLIENIQRQSMNPLEEANAFRTYVDDFGWGGVRQLAQRLGKHPSYITKRIKLLDLPSDVRDSVTKSIISPSAAEELLSLDKSQQSEIATLIGDRHLSIASIRSILRSRKNNHTIEFERSISQKADSEQIKFSKSFDKCIIGLRIGMNRIRQEIEDNQDNWVMYEILMQHNTMIHSQIDLLIKQKQKRKRAYSNHINL